MRTTVTYLDIHMCADHILRAWFLMFLVRMRLWFRSKCCYRHCCVLLMKVECNLALNCHWAKKVNCHWAKKAYPEWVFGAVVIWGEDVTWGAVSHIRVPGVESLAPFRVQLSVTVDPERPAEGGFLSAPLSAFQTQWKHTQRENTHINVAWTADMKP